ncbi:hypothetical protein E2C01_071926 [Portunus trituberculatus]|uniref:Uncharacterized protein n=1 Tax=Portunus trituberculatus TaxID=210409 RepID=A0A5B7I175_PORTR|nr:hypothetical protein [Portunus trituberculatus]
MFKGIKKRFNSSRLASAPSVRSIQGHSCQHASAAWASLFSLTPIPRSTAPRSPYTIITTLPPSSKQLIFPSNTASYLTLTPPGGVCPKLLEM